MTGTARQVRLIFAALIAAIILACPNPAHAEKLPLARDGASDSAIYNGQQNMPVRLYGVARKWARDCARGRAGSCEQLADAFATGLGDLKANTRIAGGYYLSACEKGAARACATYAGLALGGSLPLPDPGPAVTSAQRGCRAGSQDACAWLGVATYRGEGVTRNADYAVKLWRAACAGASDDGCRFLTNHLAQEGESSGNPSSEARNLFNHHCARDARPWACLGAARMLGPDSAGSVRLLERGCMEGEGDKLKVCAEYGARIITRRHRESVMLAEGFLNSACTAGIADACYAIGRHGFTANAALGEVTPGEAGFYLRRACDFDHAQGCHGLARAYLDNRMGKAGSEQRMAAVMLMLKSCRLGHSPACSWARANNAEAQSGVILAQMVDPSLPAAEQLARAIELADRGGSARARNTVALLMEEQYEEAEWLLGNWFLTGKPGIVPKNERNAVILIENAARVGHVEAAKWMGMAHWYGRQGVTQDRKVGLNYMRIAARFGDEEATLILRSMLAEPERQRRAERARQMAEAAKRQRSIFSGWLAALSSGSWASSNRVGISASQRAANASWQRHQSSMDKLHFNQRMDYLTGRSTACNYSNPYC